MSSGTEPITLRTKIEDAMRQTQEALGLPIGSRSLWPGTASLVACEVVADVFDVVFEGIDAIIRATDDPEQPGEMQRLADVTQIADDLKHRIEKMLIDKYPPTNHNPEMPY